MLAEIDLDSDTMNLHFAFAVRLARWLRSSRRRSASRWRDLGRCTRRLSTISAIRSFSVFAVSSDGNAIEIDYGVTAAPAVQERLCLVHKLFESFSGRFRLKTYV
jgi:hypothetical protein